ncbi:MULTISPECIES: SRPBCC family protein [Streptomyces]|uniref:SRPBCC family protein n=1 Tax=Streptomyces TaxID=1883 RepID=UPI001D1357BB|nr:MULTISPECIES: SRPBCC family protein [Streptomyces]MCC3653742.1 SRPBCC family protein [Streptomyces sp. S07_1.15]MCC9741341.1 SRPBCC family protein [Streptomyces sp. MNU89]WSQ71731.1 SRPBCC family protein [Streptomyces xinghaiensis]
MPEQTIPDVRKSVTVAATPGRCFEVFTERPADWWPPSHVLLKKERAGLAFEPGEGGRYYEWDVEGNQIDWGRILEWEPGRRLVMTWRISPSWQSVPDDEFASEIEVDFVPEGPGRTRVELAHVKLHRHGEGAENIWRALDGPSPGETLERFAALF